MADAPLLVTSALPYANGPLHFGHIAGAYLPADVYVRHQRLRRGLGSEPRTDIDPGVLFICGTDEHGVAITLNAEKAGQSYQDYVDRWHRDIVALFERFQISFDHFSRTTNKEPHYALSQEFFLRLLKAGKVRAASDRQHYCPRCARFLPDRYVEGTCYLCGAKGARGDECKSCGEWLDPLRLVEPRCRTCGATPEIRETVQYELDLRRTTEVMLAGFNAQASPTPLDDAGQALWNMALSFINSKENVRNTVFHKQLVEDGGLTTRPITRDLLWGVPLPALDLDGQPLANHEGKVLYVWFDAPIGYISATIEWARERETPELWRKYWIRNKDNDPRLLHFIGKDNIVFHCVVFPTMLAWQGHHPKLMGPREGESWVLPEDVPANEFYNLEGRKFSTSDNWTLDNDRMIERFGVDALRWYIVRSMPEREDSHFTFGELQAVVNNELADVIGNYASRVLKFIQTHLGGVVPEPDRGLDLIAKEADAVASYMHGDGLEGAAENSALTRAPVVANLARARSRALREVESRIDGHSVIDTFRNAASEIVSFTRTCGNQLFDAQAPWKLRKVSAAPGSPCATSLFGHVQVLATLSVLLTPFIPGAAARLRAMLNLAPAKDWSLTGEPGRDELPAGHVLGAPGILFAKIEDAVVAEEKARLGAVAR